jgi:hypothetical protein
MLYTAKKSATGLDGSGNLISVGYQTGATVGSEWATVVGNAITVYIQDGTTTDTQIKNAVYANNFSSSLVTLTGFTTVAQTSQVATFLSGGVNSQIFYTSGIVTKANHGYTSGRLGQLTTTTTLPAGLSTGTDYYIVKVTDNTFGFATSYATAFSTSGIVNVTADTAGVHTFTPTAASATAKIQYSNDGNTWLDIASMSGSTNSTGSVIYNQADAYWAYIRFMHTVAAGQANVSCVLTRKE